MAEFWSNSDRGYRLRLWIDQVSQDVEQNTSQVRARLSLHNEWYSFAEYNCYANVVIDGQKQEWSGRPAMLQFNSMIWLIDRTFTVRHNEDGAKNFGFSAHFSGDGGWSPAPGSLNISSNFTLTTIPRTSDITLSNCVIGQMCSIGIRRAVGSYYHEIRYHFGNQQGLVTSNAGSYANWYVPMELAREIPNNISGVGTLYITTFNAGRRLGTKSVSFTASLPDSIQPSLESITLVDKNKTAAGLVPGNTFIQIVSDIAVSFNGAQGSYGSTIKSMEASIVGKKYSINSNGQSFGPLDFNGRVKVRATITDSRGRTSLPKEVEINVLEYFPPALSIQVYRTRQNPSTLQVVRNFKFAPILVNGVQKNKGTLKFKVAPINTDNYVNDTGPAAGEWRAISQLTNSAANLAGNYPSSKSFTVVAEFTDLFTQQALSASATVSTEAVIHAYDKEGRLGVGKVPENGRYGSVDIAGDYYSGGNMIQHYPITNKDGSLGKGPAQWDAPWNVQGTQFGWRSGKYADNPTGKGGDWGFLQHYWIDSWKMVQIFTAISSGRTFIRSSNNGREWKPNQWKEFAFKDETNLINTGWKEAGYADSYYKRVGDVLTIRYNFVGNGDTIQFANIPKDIFTAPQSYMLMIAGWVIPGSDGNVHVQVNKGTGNFHALATHNGVIYAGQLTIML